MNAKHLTIATIAVLAALVQPASAEVEKTIKGVDYFSTNVWTNQLDADGFVVAFPRGCRGNDCDFTVFVEFREGIGSKAAKTCRNDPETPWDDCHPDDHCIALVEFGDHILPLQDGHGRNPENNKDATNALMSITWLQRDRRSTVMSNWAPNDTFNGAAEQWLWVISSRLKITANGLCNFGVALAYHPNGKTVFSKGLLLPR